MWQNRPLIVYHGTDSLSGSKLVPSLAFCRPRTDFGQGFYTTTSLHQAKQWANAKVLRRRAAPAQAMVLEYRPDRDWLATLDTLAFVRETPEFWAFVSDCRNGVSPHGRNGKNPAFDLVSGLVTLWPQTITLANCDQYSFHTAKALQSMPRCHRTHTATIGQQTF